MTPERRYLAALLRNAHVMEGQAMTLVETQIHRLKNYPEIVIRLRRYLEELGDNQSQLQRCLHQLGEDRFPLWDSAIKTRANLPDIAHLSSTDDLLKQVMGNNITELVKADAYRWLSEAAHVADEPEIAKICDRLGAQGWARAEWMWEQLPPATRERLLAL
jgi:ferritin-like metal-binding protein YciE